jgi:uncharacterized protein (DUF608 family)
MDEANDPCCGGGPCVESTRRTFLQQAAVVGAGFLGPLPKTLPGGPQEPRGDHLVPADKGLSKQWLEALRRRGAPAPLAGAQLRCVAMPCGGIAAGQLYVTGDGRLSRWWIANDVCHTSYGGDTEVITPAGTIGVCYGTYAPEHDVQQGALLAWRRGDGPFEVVGLDGDDVATTFLGEYPVATIGFRGKQVPLPVQVRAEVFSPFVPLQAKDSALPAVLLRYTLRNEGQAPVTAVLASFLQNPVLRSQRGVLGASLRNTAARQDGLAAVVMDAVEPPPVATDPGVVFEDFEHGYGKWHAEGDALGSEPAAGTLEKQQQVMGFVGERLVNTFRGGDVATGRLLSPEFTIEKRYIVFRIGGGQDLAELSLSLLVRVGRGSEGWAVVRRATGERRELLREKYWDVGDLLGERAQLVIEDRRKGGWGHVNVDHIRFCDTAPALEAVTAAHPQAGEVALCALDPGATVHPELASKEQVREWLAGGAASPAATAAHGSFDRPALGAVASTVTLQPGEQRTLTFAVTWFFPNRHQHAEEGLHPGQQCGIDGPRVGNRYAKWFASALAVALHLRDHGERLVRDTMSFRDALYRDTTLPGWFTQRIGMPLSTLATGVVQWWEDGRVWAWEGVGCCAGTCGHVWNYAQGMARLFPELERSVREHQDFAAGRGLKPDGAIGFRGTARNIWAGDAQGGYVLKAWREHLGSPDDAFLQRTWPVVKQALSFLIGQDAGEADGEADGLLDGKQHNTYDIDFFGANTMVGSMYLGALAAGAQMAARMGEPEFAARCKELLRRGSEATMQRLWNGEYFVQQVDGKAHPKWQYGNGCLSDQLLGQWFADQVGLGYLYPRDAVRKALQSIWKYNWAPDCGPQMRAHRPERDFVHPGEAGLFLCTWPRGAHPGEDSVRYRDEVWTGIEYQVAAHLLREGFVTEGLAIVRAIHDRYDGRKHNPWNEVECGDHYARALASWSCLLAISGFEYDGPAGMLGMAPRIDAGDFRCFFSASEGWGTLQQTRGDGEQQNVVAVRWGTLRVRELRFEVAAGHAVGKATVTVGGAAVTARMKQDGAAMQVAFEQAVVVAAGGAIDVRLS